MPSPYNSQGGFACECKLQKREVFDRQPQGHEFTWTPHPEYRFPSDKTRFTIKVNDNVDAVIVCVDWDETPIRFYHSKTRRQLHEMMLDIRILPEKGAIFRPGEMFFVSYDGFIIYYGPDYAKSDRALIYE